MTDSGVTPLSQTQGNRIWNVGRATIDGELSEASISSADKRGLAAELMKADAPLAASPAPIRVYQRMKMLR
jgi:hypothetical protein